MTQCAASGAGGFPDAIWEPERGACIPDDILLQCSLVGTINIMFIMGTLTRWLAKHESNRSRAFAELSDPAQ